MLCRQQTAAVQEIFLQYLQETVSWLPYFLQKNYGTFSSYDIRQTLDVIINASIAQIIWMIFYEPCSGWRGFSESQNFPPRSRQSSNWQVKLPCMLLHAWSKSSNMTWYLRCPIFNSCPYSLPHPPWRPFLIQEVNPIIIQRNVSYPSKARPKPELRHHPTILKKNREKVILCGKNPLKWNISHPPLPPFYPQSSRDLPCICKLHGAILFH